FIDPFVGEQSALRWAVTLGGGIIVTLRQHQPWTLLIVALGLTVALVSPPTTSEAQSSGDEIACGRTLYAEDFSSPASGWLRRSSDGAELGYTEDETYAISTSIESNVVWTWAPVNGDNLPEDGFCLSVKAQERNLESNGDDGRAMALGLAFAGEPQVPSLTTFGLAPASGAYRVRDRDFDEETSADIVDWAVAEEIQGPDSWNEIRIGVRGEALHVYINGERVDAVTTETRGDVGIFIESFDDADVRGVFDDFRIRSLAEDPDDESD
ncbi:MAG: hypothetical protein ABEL51_12290, partial [Salinibacter sp.]